MELDLTKPIVVVPGTYFEPTFAVRLWDPRTRESIRYKRDDEEAMLAYKALFEAAPRTKLEHGELLIALKNLAMRCDTIELFLRHNYADEAGSLHEEVAQCKKLIAEIEK